MHGLALNQRRISRSLWWQPRLISASTYVRDSSTSFPHTYARHRALVDLKEHGVDKSITSMTCPLIALMALNELCDVLPLGSAMWVTRSSWTTSRTRTCAWR